MRIMNLLPIFLLATLTSGGETTTQACVPSSSGAPYPLYIHCPSSSNTNSDEDYLESVIGTALPRTLYDLLETNLPSAFAAIKQELYAPTATGEPSWFTHMPTRAQTLLDPGVVAYEKTHNFALPTGGTGRRSRAAALGVGVAVGVGVLGV
ncbi:hypothetical protein K470DRAFT_294018 [Piedraia hortae CBS 480.64]|uniref:Uncharacterized protein n=1 Tax=Piedraia hortae CBS 480.64 TaxID=1314780 RepID=A0A6A7C410_9PEZI|nr:hypothetical protein K470DRAFT_294018 [Piedraia hortae CBS 480.64]